MKSTTRNHPALPVLALGLLLLSPAIRAQTDPVAAPAGASAASTPQNVEKAPLSAKQQEMKAMKEESGSGMDMDSMMKSMQGGSPPPGARDPDAYADGLKLDLKPGLNMADDDLYGRLLLDRLEAFHGNDGNGQAIDAQAWVGGDINKAWFKVDGERSNGRLGATRAEALWNRAIATYWGAQLGVRHDFGDGPGRTWAAVGVQGLAPYWFDIEGTAYLGPNGRTALRLEAEYEMLLTQRLILQPDIEANLYGKSDRERGLGAGLANVEVGLRLRYEFSRKFAPYVGVVWNRRFGQTASLAREDREPVFENKIVAGVRIWF